MNATMSKRGFLQAVGAAAGVGAVYRTMEALGLAGTGAAHAATPKLPPGSGEGRSVAILGAGIAGMAAAHELSKAGYRCTILEASGRAGGRNLTARAGDAIDEVDSRQRVRFGDEDHLYANLGPARIPHHHTTMLGYCKAFGVELEVFTNDNRAALFHNLERFGGRPVTARRAITDTRGYIAELLAKAVDAGSLDSALTAEDKERILQMLVQYGDLGEDRLYRGTKRGGYRGKRVNAGLEAGDFDDPLDFGELLQADFWRYKLHYDDFLDQNPTLPAAGRRHGRHRQGFREARRRPAYATAASSRRSAGRPRASASSTGRRRAAGPPPLYADFAICTIPAPVLKDIANDFAPDTRAAIASVAFVPAVKIAFQARRRFWEEDHAIYGGITWTDQDITQIWYPPYGYHRDRGVVMGAYIWDGEPALRFRRDESGRAPVGRDRRG